MLIKLTLPTLLDLDGGKIKLKPGINEVDYEAFDRVSRTRPVEHYLRTGALVVVDEGKRPEPGKKDDGTLAGRKVPEAVALVAETTDVDLLRRWSDEDKRAGVQEAITRRLAELAPEKD